MFLKRVLGPNVSMKAALSQKLFALYLKKLTGHYTTDYVVSTTIKNTIMMNLR
jgi:hypothetical protein